MNRSAKWIWAARERESVDCHLLARRVFSLPAAPSGATLQITACSHYRLFVNGRRVGDGPPRSEWPEIYLDSYASEDLPLRRGRNVIAVVAYNINLAQHGQPPAPGGLLVQLSAKCGKKTVTVESNGEWRMIVAPQYKKVAPRRMFTVGFTEIYDSRLEPHGWTEADFDDRSWPQADVVAKQPAAPYTKVLPCPLPPLTHELVRPASVGRCGSAGKLAGITGLPFEFAVFGAEDDEFYGATFVYSPRKQHVRLDFAADNRAAVFINNKRMICQGQNDQFFNHLYYETDSYTGLYYGHGLRIPGAEVILEKGWNSVGVVLGSPHDTWGFVCRFSDLATGRTLPLRFSPNRKMNDLPSWQVLSDSHLLDGCDGMLLDTPELNAGTFPSPAHLAAWEPRRPATLKNLRTLCAGERGSCLLPPNAVATFVMPAELVGCIELEVRGQPGAALDITAGEALNPTGYLNPLRDGVWLTDRVILNGGWTKWRSFDRRAMRYIELAVRNATGPVEVRLLRLDAQHYPPPAPALFVSSDKIFNKLWSVGLATLDACTSENFEDCPIREMGQWFGDVVVEGLVAAAVWGDEALTAKALRQYAADQPADRWMRPIVPSGYGDTLSDYALLYPHLLQRHYQTWGDAKILDDCFPAVVRGLAFAETFVNKDGLLDNDPSPKNFVLLDHTVVDAHREMEIISGYQAFYLVALESAAQVADVLGQKTKAKRWRALAAKNRDAARHLLFDEKEGLFAESFTGGRLDGKFTATTNYLALFAGQATPEQEERILRRLWPAPTREAGKLWPSRETPYFKYFVLEALFARGLWRQAFSVLRDYYGAMLRRPEAWTLFELFQHDLSPQKPVMNSLCHGWSTAPLLYYFRWICGLRPAAPGFDRLGVEPQPGDLKSLAASLPTRHGPVLLQMVSDRKGRTITVTAPRNMAVELRRTYLGPNDLLVRV